MIKTTLVESLDKTEQSLTIDMLDFLTGICEECAINDFDSISIGEEKVTYTQKDLEYFKELVCILATGGSRIEFNKRNISATKDEL